MFCKKGVLRNFTKSTEKQLWQGLFFNKVAGLRLWHRCFPVNFVKFLRIPSFYRTLRWLLLFSYKHIFIIKKLQHFYHKEVITHITRDFIISSSLRLLLKRWKSMSEQRIIITMMKNNYFFIKIYILNHRAQ